MLRKRKLNKKNTLRKIKKRYECGNHIIVHEEYEDILDILSLL